MGDYESLWNHVLRGVFGEDHDALSTVQGDIVRAAIKAVREWDAVHGWQTVPVTADTLMLDAAHDAHKEQGLIARKKMAVLNAPVYEAMLAAAPNPVGAS